MNAVRLVNRLSRQPIFGRIMNDHHRSLVARRFPQFQTVFCLLTVLFTLICTVEKPPLSKSSSWAVETAIDGVFALEVLARFLAYQRMVAFFENAHNIIDLVAILPRFTHAMVLAVPELRENELVDSVVLGLFLTLRILKLMRHLEKSRLFLCAFDIAMEAIPTIMYSMLVLAVFFSSCIYVVEPRDNIPTFTRAMWLAIVTMTTVGYGDVTPDTLAGTIIVACLVVCSVLYMAMPVGVVGQAFSQVWLDRDKILLVRHVQDHLNQHGVTPDEVGKLFKYYDEDGDSELELPEFHRFMSSLGVATNDRRIVALFESLDKDSSGVVSGQEFVQAIYPKTNITI